ncbi:hypothetical protein GCM10011519_21560 [Marmoricola endophyticus]|uniref:Secreted protein n=1 Tax=Marmoricola endophyticus TaxID=2040280 RepID=A0A917BN41_9ACTN|nr:DUF6049 family protein [Marmoricola endophyticus]GGF47202.1 hypothetical protein GCM10011519_21560 [Marmoricola endophyticus]
MSTGSVARPARRPRSTRRLLALLVLVLLGCLLVTPPPASAADDPPDQGEPGPLQVQLTTLSPAVLPRSGTVTLSGTVTNLDTDPWRDVNVSTWVSSTPMRSSEELEEASQTPYDAEVGMRSEDPSTFVSIGDLAAGQSTEFTIRVPRDKLDIPQTPGAYWIGVHALGTSTEGRDSVADGRARTFIPVVEDGARRRPVPAAFVLPVRQEVRRDPSGHLVDPAEWTRLLGEDGRLGRILGLGRTAGAIPLTLLADPAVLDAAAVLARDSRTAAQQDSGDDDRDDEQATADLAQGWLERVVDLAQRNRTLALGYADPDTASLARRAPRLLDDAVRLSRTSFSARGVDSTSPTAAPVDGVLPASALATLSAGTQVLLSRRAAPDGTPGYARTAQGQPLALVDTDATARGPGPGPVDDALSYRQRILCEAALRQAEGDTSTMVVVPPADWDPGSQWSSSAFFSSLDVPWLRWSSLGTSGTSTVRDPAYDGSDAAAQVGDRLVDASRAASRSGSTFASALQRPGDVADAYQRLALRGVSYAARDDRSRAYADVRALDASVRSRLDRVRVSGSNLVTLAGGSGSFVISMTNDLDRPVTVGLAATTSNADLSLRLPKSVTLPARKRTTVPIEASSQQTGVRSVTLRATTPDGTPIGTGMTFNVRDSQVSSLIWAVLAAGVLLVVAMVVRRIRSRNGLRRPAHEPGPDA